MLHFPVRFSSHFLLFFLDSSISVALLSPVIMAAMDRIERILSRPTAKPYRSKALEASEKPHLNSDGLLDFAPNDIENPKNWSNPRRWYITVVSVLLVVNATFASSSPSGSVNGIAEQFGVSVEAANLVITLFLLGYCFGPLFWAPLSEFYGRRWIFYISFTCYLIFNFLCAFAPNFASLLVGRFLTGTFAASPLVSPQIPGAKFPTSSLSLEFQDVPCEFACAAKILTTTCKAFQRGNLTPSSS